MNRDFKGIWIPREIWLAQDLKAQEKALWAEIHSLYDEEHGGCYASNDYLCEFIGVKERRLQVMIATLKEKGWLEQVSFNGRQRILKAIIPTDDPSCVRGRGAVNCGSEVHKNAPLGCSKMHPSPYIENKEYKKEERKDPPPLFSFGKHIKMNQSEYDQFIAQYGKTVIDEYLQSIDDYISSVRGKPYIDSAAALRNWILRDKKNGKEKVGEESNEDFAKKIAESYNQVRGPLRQVKLEALNGRLEIYSSHRTSTRAATVIKYSENGFKDQVESALRKWGLK